MSIFECLKDYESKHGKLSKKNPQVQDESVLRERNKMFKKMLCHHDNSNEEKSKGEK